MLFSRLFFFWKFFVIDKPLVTIIFSLFLVAGSAFYIPDLRFDISADSLVLESDKDLDYYRSIRARYGSDTFVILTYDPDGNVFSNESLGELKDLQENVEKIEGVKSVVSILNVPLLESPPVSIGDLKKDLPMILDESTDLDLAREEIQKSPLYKNQIISEDGSLTSLIINLTEPDKYASLMEQRGEILEARLDRDLSESEKRELGVLERKVEALNAESMEHLSLVVDKIKNIREAYTGKANIYIGGLPVLVSDMMSFVKKDLVVFGTVVLLFVCIVLYLIFRSISWVFVQLMVAFSGAVITTGVIALVGWPITVVSSSYFALILIFTISLCIHLLVKYQELIAQSEDGSKVDLLVSTLSEKFSPCFWTVLTTSVAFSSLVVSEVGPVIDFGWTMVIGLWISLILCFTFFPAVLILLPRKRKSKASLIGRKLAEDLGVFALKNIKWVFALSLIILLVTSWGTTKLTLENRFLDYFRESTEIYKSTKVIDTKFGGTMPMDIILDAPKDYEPLEAMDEPFGETTEPGITETGYWMNTFILEEVKQIHEYIVTFQEIGKVISVATPLEIVEALKDGEPLENYELAILLSKLPEKSEEVLIDPYVGPDGNQLRISTRVHESDPDLDRRWLINSLREGLIEKFDLKKDQINFSGMFVLYNNMIESLFRSQILTLGTVFVAILVLFAFAFRSLKLAAIAIVPNAFTAIIVLGLMGLAGIPLNFMTITIAAVTIGIAVDDTIHYIHRFVQEMKDGTTEESIFAVHRTIGLACSCTTLTIAFGFSALFFSDFLPTVYFGLLTGVAMITAYIVDMTILPVMLKKIFVRNKL